MPKSQVEWTIEIPDVHPSLNTWTRMHWGKRNALKHSFEQQVFFYAKQAGVPIIKEPVEIFITYHHPRQTVDLDNYTPKFFIDGLKTFFGDDNILHLKKLGWTFVKGDKKKSVIVIKLAT